MALDQQSKEDLLAICDNSLLFLEQQCDDREREDVFYVPILVVAAIRCDKKGSMEVEGADIAFDDKQPRDGIANVLSTVVEVLRGNHEAEVKVTTVSGALLS